jgi:hypothetical protein
MKKLFALSFLFIAANCTQGLRNNVRRSKDDDISEGSTTGEEDPPIVTQASIVTTATTTPGLFKTVFVNTSGLPPSTPIEGLGWKLDNAASYCISNEQRSPSDTPDNSPCYKPLSHNNQSTEEDNLLRALKRVDADDVPTDADGLPFVIQGLRLFFSNNTAVPPKKNYSSVVADSFAIRIKTAPIKIESDTLSTGDPKPIRKLYWDETAIETYDYTLPGSNPGNPLQCSSSSNISTTSLDISSLGANAKYYFLTGLWVFERAELMPFENEMQDPVASTSPTSLIGAFSTRTSVLGSFLTPNKAANGAPEFYFFPGSGADKTATPDPGPGALFTFGKYREPNSLPTNVDTPGTNINEFGNENNMTNLNGVIATPIMGKYRSGAEQNGWQQRAIVSICIRGERNIFFNQNAPYPETKNFPLVQALRGELRKISVQLEQVK